MLIWFYDSIKKIHSNQQGSNDFVPFFNLYWGWEKMNIIDTEFFFFETNTVHLDWQMLNNQS